MMPSLLLRGSAPARAHLTLRRLDCAVVAVRQGGAHVPVDVPDLYGPAFHGRDERSDAATDFRLRCSAHAALLRMLGHDAASLASVWICIDQLGGGVSLQVSDAGISRWEGRRV